LRGREPFDQFLRLLAAAVIQVNTGNPAGDSFFKPIVLAVANQVKITHGCSVPF
jgi:hypothetical protein